MKADDLRSTLEELGLTQVQFAHLIDVTPRAVSLWITEQREIPGPAAAYLRLLASLPKAIQAGEIARSKEDQIMPDGMYSVAFSGQSGSGVGVMVMSNGVVFGYDTGGAKYDGTYAPGAQRGDVDLHLQLTVPPGTALVQGVPPLPMEYAFNIDCTIQARSVSYFNVQTPFGEVRANINFLRGIPN